MNLAVNLCGVRLKNPVIAASGTFRYGEEFNRLYDVGCLGGIATTGITLNPRPGNPPPRVTEGEMLMLNAVGLQNEGAQAFIERELPRMRQYGTAIIANVAGSTLEEYCGAVERISAAAVDMVELNISCPNVKAGGMAFGVCPASVREVVAAVRPLCHKPLIVKLTPNVADIRENAIAAQEGGADAISLINTLTGMLIDVKNRRPVLANITGGMSGPALLPLALRMVWQAAGAVSIPVIGMGGIRRGEDAAAFLLAGASAVMVGSANFADPYACPRIIRELEAYLASQGLSGVAELVGGLRLD